MASFRGHIDGRKSLRVIFIKTKMSNLNVKQVLSIYQTRLKMQQDGITNPTQIYKDITRTIVEKLSKMSLDEELIWDDYKMKDSKGNIIVQFPKGEKLL